MKKVMMTMFFATLVPFIGENLTRYGLCNANEIDRGIPQNWPDVAIVFSSYYNQTDNTLHIYGGTESTVVSVEVTYHRALVLTDCIMPREQSAVYDFSNCDSGTYEVTISVGDTELNTFWFEKY